MSVVLANGEVVAVAFSPPGGIPRSIWLASMGNKDFELDRYLGLI